MTEIDRLGRLVAEVRATLSEKSQRTASVPNSHTAKSKLSTGSTLSAEQIRQGAVGNLKALGRITDGNRRQARRRFIEWAVLGELGFQLAEDNEFTMLCDRVLSAFEANSDVASKLDDMILRLTQSPQ